MVGRISDEDALGGACGELVRRSGDHVGEAQAPEDAELVVGWCDAEQQVVRSRSARGATGAAVDQPRRRGQCLGLEW